MFDALASFENISFVLVFFEGILSFLSPCVLPLIPIYISYLAGNAKKKNADGSITYIRKKVLFHTLFFILGISTAFFVLGLSVTSLGKFFNTNKALFSKIAGIIIIVLGLYQVGIFDFKFLQKERKINLDLRDKSINPFMAYIMGFTFSFAWTPCVGPALSSVLILASSAKNSGLGNLLVLVYTVGFTIPFLLLGLFTTQALNFIKKNRKIMKYTIKIGGIIMIIMGVMTFTGWVNSITGYLTPGGSGQSTTQQSDTREEEQEKENAKEEANKGEAPDAIDFELVDQYGNTHKLSDYKGKVVFLNFWATWCPPCKMEMPNIEELYKEYNYNKDDVVILGVANPGGQEKSVSGIKEFLKDNNYTFPVVFDETGRLFSEYYIRALPTTFMIDKDGKVYGYVTAALTKEQMKSIITQTMEKK